MTQIEYIQVPVYFARDFFPILQAMGLKGWQFVSKIDRIDEKGEIFYELIMMRELNQEDNNENLLDKARELRFMRRVLEYITQTQTKNV